MAVFDKSHRGTAISRQVLLKSWSRGIEKMTSPGDDPQPTATSSVRLKMIVPPEKSTYEVPCYPWSHTSPEFG